jgi:hypothetical protein
LKKTKEFHDEAIEQNIEIENRIRVVLVAWKLHYNDIFYLGKEHDFLFQWGESSLTMQILALVRLSLPLAAQCD